MGIARFHRRVKLTVGVITSDCCEFPGVRQALVGKLGETDFESPWIAFRFTGYYRQEMGDQLWRKFLCFHHLIWPQDIISTKLFTNEIEQRFISGTPPRRLVNLDPGYVTLAKLVLATTKDYSHRVYLNKGIYAEVTLRYVRGSGFAPWEWTYPDYRTSAYRTFFDGVRHIYQHQLNEDSGSGK